MPMVFQVVSWLLSFDAKWVYPDFLLVFNKSIQWVNLFWWVKFPTFLPSFVPRCELLSWNPGPYRDHLHERPIFHWSTKGIERSCMPLSSRNNCHETAWFFTLSWWFCLVFSANDLIKMSPLPGEDSARLIHWFPDGPDLGHTSPQIKDIQAF